MTITNKATYYLHINDEGSETTYSEPPTDVKTLKVEVQSDGSWEITWTRNIGFEGEIGTNPVRPRGEGRHFVDDAEEEGSCVWWRRRR